MSALILEVDVKHGGCVELCESKVKYWKSWGLPDFEGTLDGLLLEYPEVIAELVARKIIK